MSAARLQNVPDGAFTLGDVLIVPHAQRLRTQPRFRRSHARPRHPNPSYVSSQQLDGTRDPAEAKLDEGVEPANKRTKLDQAAVAQDDSLVGKARLTRMLADEAALGDVEEGVAGRYEYLDHTADVQLHAWGDNMAEAFANAAVAMFGYMSKLSLVEVDHQSSTYLEIEAHDLDSLLLKFLEDCLNVFTSTDIIVKTVTVHKLDLENCSLSATLLGEKFDMEKHTQGTEVKAITYSAMQILKGKQDDPQVDRERSEVYVIIDI